MTKRQLIDLVRELLSGGDAPAEIRGKYHPKVVAKYLEMAFDDIIAVVALEGKQTGDYSLLDKFALPYIQPILYNTSREQKYCTLPVLVMPLPDNSAVRSISPPKDQSTQFAYIAISSQPVWAALDVDAIDPVAGFTIENDTIFFDDKFPYGLENVMLKLVASFGALEWDDKIEVPSGKNEMLFTKVFTLMMQKKANPQDYYDDGNNKQV